MGKKGPVAMKLASLYKNKIKVNGKGSIEVMKDAQKLFDNDSDENRKKCLKELKTN